jgi:hypothetical protein
MLWIGIAIGIAEWLWPVASRSHDYLVFIVPGLFVASGVVSHILCYRFVRHERRT